MTYKYLKFVLKYAVGVKVVTFLHRMSVKIHSIAASQQAKLLEAPCQQKHHKHSTTAVVICKVCSDSRRPDLSTANSDGLNIQLEIKPDWIPSLLIQANTQQVIIQDLQFILQRDALHTFTFILFYF